LWPTNQSSAAASAPMMIIKEMRDSLGRVVELAVFIERIPSSS
jgi:hypothetical protein